MENEPMKAMTRLTDIANKRPIYIDLDLVAHVGTWQKGDFGYFNPPSTTPEIVHCTILTTINGAQFFIEEHLTEVLAMMEGRDPAPSKVLFGRKSV